MNRKIESFVKIVCAHIDKIPLLRPKKSKGVACACAAVVVLLALVRMFGGETAQCAYSSAVAQDWKVSFASVRSGADSPKEIVECYYNAYKDGDAVRFLNCVDYTEEEKLCMIEPLRQKMLAKDWKQQAQIAYAKLTYESEEVRPFDAELGCEWATANAYVEASSEWCGSSKNAGRLWNMKKIGDKWFIDKNSGAGAHWMGLTDLANPDSTQPGN